MDSEYHARISPMGVMCAQMFAEDTTIPYAREIYHELQKEDCALVEDGKQVRSQGLISLFRLVPDLRAIISVLEGRYLASNRALSRDGPFHILELAGGLSARGLTFTRADSNQIYIDTDLTELSHLKRSVVAAIRNRESNDGAVATPNYHITPLNALDKVAFEAALSPYVHAEQKRPLAIVNEGLMMYLDNNHQEVLRDNVVEMLTRYSPDGAWYTPDPSLRVENLTPNPLLQSFIQWRMRTLEQKRRLSFNFFKSEEQVIQFMNKGGLEVEVVSSEPIVDDLSCKDKLRVNKERLRKKSHLYDMYRMRLR